MSAAPSTPRIALVTGGGSGIGKAIVARLAADGHRVATLDLVPGDGEFAYTADVTDRGQIDAALAQIHQQLGPVGILVNAAGLDGFKPFLKISFEDWQRVVNVNLHGVFHMCQAVLPEMLAAGWGRIVNISSSSTHSGTPYMSHYVSAKSGVNVAARAKLSAAANHLWVIVRSSITNGRSTIAAGRSVLQIGPNPTSSRR